MSHADPQTNTFPSDSEMIFPRLQHVMINQTKRRVACVVLSLFHLFYIYFPSFLLLWRNCNRWVGGNGEGVRSDMSPTADESFHFARDRQTDIEWVRQLTELHMVLVANKFTLPRSLNGRKTCARRAHFTPELSSTFIRSATLWTSSTIKHKSMHVKSVMRSCISGGGELAPFVATAGANYHKINKLGSAFSSWAETLITELPFERIFIAFYIVEIVFFFKSDEREMLEIM